MKHFDAIIIGTGQAGPSLAARFAGAGKTVAIIERHKFGGTCVNTGCIPTKTLVASAYAIHVARRGAEYGFSTGDMRVDIKRVKARKDAVSARSNKGGVAPGNDKLYGDSGSCQVSVVEHRHGQR
jgi:pyruvate/2-oxoglutarate dehydrogenase complex dihydrolipoamide dehydrogenase (E3) component